MSDSKELFVKNILPEVVEDGFVKRGKKGGWKRKRLAGKKSGLFSRKTNRSEVSRIVG